MQPRILGLFNPQLHNTREGRSLTACCRDGGPERSWCQGMRDSLRDLGTSPSISGGRHRTELYIDEKVFSSAWNPCFRDDAVLLGSLRFV